MKSEHDFGPVWNCAMVVEIELDHRKIKLEIRQASQKQSFQDRIRSPQSNNNINLSELVSL